jgi:hypothetical protein
MKAARLTVIAAAAGLLAIVLVAYQAFGNGGPFLVKYPGGDPAAKGVLARLDPSLKPAEESRLRVVKEDLTFYFISSGIPFSPPRVNVTAAYTIENPTDQDIDIDFGFPILRGIHLLIDKGGPYADAAVKVEYEDPAGINDASKNKNQTAPKILEERPKQTIITNSHIYGLIRQNARELIEKAVAADAELNRRVILVRSLSSILEHSTALSTDAKSPASIIASGNPRNTSGDLGQARGDLQAYLKTNLFWEARDAQLMVEYASLIFENDMDPPQNSNFRKSTSPLDSWVANINVLRSLSGLSAEEGKEVQHFNEMMKKNMGPLSAIGEQKATQFFAYLASKFDKTAGLSYESLFKAWGGDVRERSLDLRTGEIRPREVNLIKWTRDFGVGTPIAANDPSIIFDPIVNPRTILDPTVYSRIDFFDPKVPLSQEASNSCQTILTNLPVVFTFAPMNLLYYQVKFPARQTRLVTVSYSQYAYVDTRNPPTFQMNYVLHPASLWKDFGPINLSILVPAGYTCKASVPLEKVRQTEKPINTGPTFVDFSKGGERDAYKAILTERKDKSGELFIATDML